MKTFEEYLETMNSVINNTPVIENFLLNKATITLVRWFDIEMYRRNFRTGNSCIDIGIGQNQDEAQLNIANFCFPKTLSEKGKYLRVYLDEGLEKALRSAKETFELKEKENEVLKEKLTFLF